MTARADDPASFTIRRATAADAHATVIGTIGCSMIDAVEGHIRGLAVRPDAQGCGVASRLLAAAEADMLDRGAARITLDTTRPLARAMQLYERRGYRRSGVTRDFFDMPLVEYVKLPG